jgi:hypothetical protein
MFVQTIYLCWVESFRCCCAELAKLSEPAVSVGQITFVVEADLDHI